MSVQVDYAPPKRDPSDEKRSATDRVFAYIGAFIFIVWLLLSCHGLYNHRTENERKSEDAKYDSLLKNIYHDSAILLGPTILVTAAIILGLFYLIYRIPKICVHAMFVYSIVFIVVQCIQIIKKLSESSQPASVWNPPVPVLCSYVVVMGSILVSLHFVKFSNIAEFIRKSFEAMFNFPSLIPFSLCMLFLQAFVFVLCSFAALQLNSDKIVEISEPTGWMIILGGVYVFGCLLCFEWMVVSQTLASWHYMDSRNDSSSPSILQSINVVIRYHMGSVAFAATGILPLCLTIYTAITHKSQKKTEVKSYLVEVLWYITLISTIPEYACILVAAYGINSSKSTRKAWEILTRKSTFSYALVMVVALLFGFVLIISFLLSFFLMMLTHLHVLFVSHIIALVIVSSIVKLVPAIETTLLFSLENDLESENENGPAYKV